VSGLKDEVGKMVELLAPATLGMAMQMANKQEKFLITMNKTNRWVGKTQNNSETSWKKTENGSKYKNNS